MVWEYLTTVTDVRTSVLDINGQKGFDAQVNTALLNQYGMEQWELVQTTPILANGHTIQIVYFFKRAIRGKAGNLPEIGYDIDHNGLTGSQR